MDKSKPAGLSIGGKKKFNRSDFILKQKENEVLIRRPGQLNGLDFAIKDLTGCTVVILDHTAQMTVDRCKNTKFFIGPIKASIFFRDCENCDITVCSSQFRCRDLYNSRINLYTPNDPIIESSKNLTFGPYNLKYPFLKSHSDQAQLVGTFVDDDGVTQKKVNKWNLIFDFTTNENGKANFKILDANQFKVVHAQELFPEIEFSDYDEHRMDKSFLFELPIEFGGTLAKQSTL